MEEIGKKGIRSRDGGRVGLGDESGVGEGGG